MATQVPGIGNDVDRGVEVLPVLHAKSKARVLFGAESKALLGSGFGPKGRQVAHSLFIGLPEAELMARSSCSDSEVISQSPGSDSHLPHHAHPGVEGEADQHHTDGAALRYAALLEMRGSQATTNGVVVKDCFMEALVGVQDLQGEAAEFKEKMNELPLDLVKAFPNVRAADNER